MFDVKTHLQELVAGLLEYRDRRIDELRDVYVGDGRTPATDVEIPEIDYQIAIYSKTLRDNF